MPADVHVEGENLIFEIGPRQFSRVESVSSGLYNVSVGELAYPHVNTTELDINVADGATCYVKVELVPSTTPGQYNWRLSLQESDVGSQDIQNCVCVAPM